MHLLTPFSLIPVKHISVASPVPDARTQQKSSSHRPYVHASLSRTQQKHIAKTSPQLQECLLQIPSTCYEAVGRFSLQCRRQDPYVS